MNISTWQVYAVICFAAAFMFSTFSLLLCLQGLLFLSPISTFAIASLLLLWMALQYLKMHNLENEPAPLFAPSAR